LRICSAVLLFLLADAAQAAFTRISIPTATYTGSTTLLPVTAVDYSTVNSVSAGGQTVTFSIPMEAISVPNGGWLTWNSPPNTESGVPKVLGTQGAGSVTLTLSNPATTFGFEAEPDPFAVYTITAVFLHNTTVIGTISLAINGNGGALLEAASSDQTITSVQISSNADFAIAQIRSGGSGGCQINKPKDDVDLSSSAAFNSTSIVFNASNPPTDVQTINWTTAVQYQTSGDRGPFSSSTTFTSSPGADVTEQYAGVGGQLTATVDCSSMPSQINITGTSIPNDAITTRLVSLYAAGATPRLLTGIAQTESTYRQFAEITLYDDDDLWPLESYDGGSHIGLMQMPVSMQMAWDWLANTQGGYALFQQKLSLAIRYANSIVSTHTGLPALTSKQIEQMAVLLYGPGASGSLTKQYYIPTCSGTVNGATCQGGKWAWTVNTNGNTVGVTYVTNIYSNIQ
jgi:hypothetical protein